MSDVLGARIGSDDPKKIAEVRESVPRILAVGAQPTPTPKQAPRLGAVYDERGYLEGRDPRTMSQEELLAMGHLPMPPIEALRARCLDCAGSIPAAAKCLGCAAWPGRSGWEKARGTDRLATNSGRRCANVAVVSPKQRKVDPRAQKIQDRVPPYPRVKMSKIRRDSSMPKNSTVSSDICGRQAGFGRLTGV